MRRDDLRRAVPRSKGGASGARVCGGATCAEDAEVLRSGVTPSKLTRRALVSSTSVTLLRDSTFGHVPKLGD